MNERLDNILRRRDDLTIQLSDPAITSDPKRYTALSREFSEIEPVAQVAAELQALHTQLKETRDMLLEPDCDPDMKKMAEEEIIALRTATTACDEKLTQMLLPKDPNDNRNVILEIRAGTGGDEAALFAADLYRMYCRFAEIKGFKTAVLSANEIGIGGYKEIIAQVTGTDVFSVFKFESGVHRVQRVPETESGGRIHTSACTVAILPEAEDVEVNIRTEDLRIDVYRASGAGGQHVNKTESAVRITHIPTGLVVTCQDQASQHKNKAQAMKVLQARLLAKEQNEAHATRAEARKDMVGSGDRSERIRTYNFPQGRITDHRINLTLYKLETILNGEMDELIQPLIVEHQAALLASQRT
ncbi:MAG: peptide chain release factor 1 [Zetaproteobacteria bacterium CG_4_9_14_3_um_filter_49_83]|nr:MAG: peptide chain release factor 1 [Zetaproteobacteria bacterium CG1_02_49_23]PIQ30651.1 MAG: peptide chain release factor 1 [Zetaproteobacteria bacterium CG17_big_fil_post_rev_8_21_14_2_50_50_13]PIV30203.1 MAG: peptide chain release factor 1 [Zetaproteobacteria bacterium CG02_land_8_20_14_3_00_50_9]PIY55113.1 MAG: peptide chain release factor 1 [Zetaproteobacteria bacterium CG_4_10_14_0_8_um_filter_49_80]PJA35290.1 MAG: peptide chain release factor 1 [Zetaproteobacteria bacterium CG_4_9_14